MAITSYVVSTSWAPDEDYINGYEASEYLAWRLGVNETLGTAVWAIYPVVNTPSIALDSLLPIGSEALSINREMGSYGYTRRFLPNLPIEKVEAYLAQQAALFHE